jgi:hypothetical protein
MLGKGYNTIMFFLLQLIGSLLAINPNPHDLIYTQFTTALVPILAPKSMMAASAFSLGP